LTKDDADGTSLWMTDALTLARLDTLVFDALACERFVRDDAVDAVVLLRPTEAVEEVSSGSPQFAGIYRPQ